jgi:uncharacterized membrane protein YdcZ (DUF606 family)
VKRLLLAGLVAGAALTVAAPANATIWACDNAPASAQCFSHTYGRWCTVWVAGKCITADRIIGPIGS